MEKKTTDFENKLKKTQDDNLKLITKINRLEKRISRIEKFNKDLRDKNNKLESELDLKKENEICDTFQNISLIQSFSYIN